MSLFFVIFRVLKYPGSNSARTSINLAMDKREKNLRLASLSKLKKLRNKETEEQYSEAQTKINVNDKLINEIFKILVEL